MPVAYTNIASKHWEPLASMALESCYEATLSAAAILTYKTGLRQQVYLTMVGGGAFGNPRKWLVAAIRRALDTHANSPIDVHLVHFRKLDADFVSELPATKATS
jgi:ABC-type tungstate transport system permease subunit